ncbi:MAG: NAD(P)H-hydrate epimerase, partial [Candidatus Sumerlaeota bacterium]
MSYKIVTAEEMGQIDKRTIEEYGVSGLELMERAGEQIAEEIMEEYMPDAVGIVTGKGNNAGDGLVVARLLAEKDVDVTVIMTTQGENLSASGKKNFERLPDSVEVLDRHSVPKMEEVFADCEVIVDALLGTGIKGAPRGEIGEAVSVMNSLDIPIVAVDIPSGLNTDTGEAEGAVIQADMTVTMGLPKMGMFMNAGPDVCGEISIVDIGFAEELLYDPEIKNHLLTGLDIQRALPARPTTGHKGTFGTLLVIAGSVGFSGAAWLTTSAGLRSGAGLVFGAYPEKVADVIAGDLVEAIHFHPDNAATGH